MQTTASLWPLPFFTLGQAGQNSADNAVQSLLGPSAGGAPAGTTTTGATTAPSGGGTSSQTPGGFSPLMMLLPLLVVFLFLGPMLAGRKDKKKRAELLSSIKKHDRVQTIGGIIGIVSDIRDDEIILKVDESSNTKIRFARSAIQQVLKSSESGATTPVAAEVQTKPRSERAAV
jgi:preprotein translocase subunit YajC